VIHKRAGDAAEAGAVVEALTAERHTERDAGADVAGAVAAGAFPADAAEAASFTPPRSDPRTISAQHECSDLSDSVLSCRVGGSAETTGQGTEIAGQGSSRVGCPVRFESCRGHPFYQAKHAKPGALTYSLPIPFPQAGPFRGCWWAPVAQVAVACWIDSNGAVAHIGHTPRGFAQSANLEGTAPAVQTGLTENAETAQVR